MDDINKLLIEDIKKNIEKVTNVIEEGEIKDRGED